jgi:hypothetical protein
VLATYPPTRIRPGSLGFYPSHWGILRSDHDLGLQSDAGHVYGRSRGYAADVIHKVCCQENAPDIQSMCRVGESESCRLCDTGPQHPPRSVQTSPSRKSNAKHTHARTRPYTDQTKAHDALLVPRGANSTTLPVCARPGEALLYGLGATRAVRCFTRRRAC